MGGYRLIDDDISGRILMRERKRGGNPESEREREREIRPKGARTEERRTY